jgi:molybdenum transport protein
MPHRSGWTGGAGWGAVACTRKNVPGTKRFAVAAVKAGGAVMHRLGQLETVLVFPEHCAFLGREPFVGLVEKLRRAAPEKRLVVEVATVEEAILAAGVGFDVIQLEKFAPAEIAALVARISLMARPVIAAAGGIHAATSPLMHKPVRMSWLPHRPIWRSRAMCM